MFQNWLANAVLRINTNTPDAKIVSLTAPMRVEKIVDDKFEFVMQNIFPLLMVIVYILPILRVISRIVHEKVRL